MGFISSKNMLQYQDVSQGYMLWMLYLLRLGLLCGALKQLHRTSRHLWGLFSETGWKTEEPVRSNVCMYKKKRKVHEPVDNDEVNINDKRKFLFQGKKSKNWPCSEILQPFHKN